MSENAISRRTSYGPSSPEVGRKGADTRRKIVDVSLQMFAEHGFFDTSVDAIAKASGVSRATLYQYFLGKDEIFLELLDECGGALMRVTTRIGAPGPTELGLDKLNRWLGEWSWVFEKYHTMFVQWAVVASVDSQVGREAIGFGGGNNKRIAARLAESGLDGFDPLIAATVVTAVVHRVNLFQHTGRSYDVHSEVLTFTLSLFLQLMLFPDTPATVLDSLPPRFVSSSTIDIPAAPPAAGLSTEDRVQGLSKRAASTVRKLVDAGAFLFAQKGYQRTRVDDIVTEAGVARGTFYKYFSEKQDLLLAITTEASVGALEHAERMRRLDLNGNDETAVRSWLASFTKFMAKYSGSIDVWTDRTTDSPLVVAIGSYAQSCLDSALESALASVQRTYPFDSVAAALIFRALITRLPEALREMSLAPSDDQVVDLLVRCIRRGFFSHAF